jgi:hypothetical protein
MQKSIGNLTLNQNTKGGKMSGKLPEESVEFYPGNCKELIGKLEGNLRMLKEKGIGHSSDMEKLISNLSKLKARCVAYDFGRQIKILKEMS